jgi:hypothetical protein
MNGFRKIFPSYATFFAKMAERKVVPFDEFYYQLKLTHLFQKPPVFCHNYVKERQRYNLRNCEDFDLQLCKFNPKCNSVYHQGLMLFNQLPIDIKACNDLSNFKRMLRVYIIDNY